MRYLSVDLETTGLNEDTCQILQLAAVLDDTSKILAEAPTFNALVWAPTYTGEAYAMWLNQDIFKTLSKTRCGNNVEHRGHWAKVCGITDLIGHFRQWLNYLGAGRLVLAGKNVANFDLKFLTKLPDWDTILMCHRVLDPGNLYLRPDDIEPPSTIECMRRAGFENPEASHDALDDAYAVCKLIRNWENTYAR